ncbi:hypothetical protein [Sorangium sp. So ce1000]|uniref:hypothetical protein n=1 Tax=Sorangium sp. So ce1000 TaxID=3133325 RepID=UPI003F5F17CF
MHNALTTNPKALSFLRKHALDDDAFDAGKHPYMSLQLTDPNARDVLGYIVSCALGPSDQLKTTDPTSPTSPTWKGELGLCPSWGKGAPSEECQQLVSACLLARVNRLHRRVPVRLTGHNLTLPRDSVAVETRYPRGDVNAGHSEGTPIMAFSRGWSPGQVGRCTPNEPVTLSISDPSSCAQTSLRVCKGIYGCYDASSEPGKYNGFLGEKTGACGDAPLTFACPGGGFYAVMTKPRAASITGGGAGAYPAPEADVFSFLEGAFFGNLFEPEGLTRFREMVLEKGRPERRGGPIPDKGDDDDALPHRNIYACYSLGTQDDTSRDDEEGAAYLNDRVCAKPGSKKKCFPNPPRRCHFKDAGVNASKGAHCTWRPGESMYQDCKGDDGVSYAPITVYLNDPCSLVDASACPAVGEAPSR